MGIKAFTLLLVLLAFETQGQCQDKTPPFTHGEIIPGERIGPLRLREPIEEIKQLLGPGALAVEGGPRRPQLFSLQMWKEIGLWVQFDSMTGNVVWIAIESGHANAWADYATPDGVRLGMRPEEVVSRMGAPEGTISGAGATSFYYDRKGLRLTFADLGPIRGRVGSIRIVWLAIPRGDTLIVPGDRISVVKLGAPVDDALKILGGGYHKGKSTREIYLYYWPHLGLGFLEYRGLVFNVRAARQVPTDGRGIHYATADGIGQESALTRIKEVFGESSEFKAASRQYGSIIYRSKGIAFSFDDADVIRTVDVFPPEPVSGPTSK
jgi:hypothetical protein